MNDALLGRVNIEELNAKLLAVSAQRFDLPQPWHPRDCIGGGNVVIDSAESKIRASYFSPAWRKPSNAWGDVTS